MAADLLRRGAAWLGFVTDNRYDEDAADYEMTQEVDPRAIEKGSAEPSSPSNVTALDARRKPSVPAEPQEKATADLSVIITVHPRTFNEARTIGEHYRDGTPVIMNLTGMEDSDAKRLVDFAAGLIFGLRGQFERVTNKVFLLSPPNVTVTAEDKQRIATGEFYNQS